MGQIYLLLALIALAMFFFATDYVSPDVVALGLVLCSRWAESISSLPK